MITKGMIKMSKRIVGLSSERSPSGIKQWVKFLDILNIEYMVSDIDISVSAKQADSFFNFSTEYCFFRRSCLGQYLDLIRRGCNTILVPVKYKDDYNNCNATRFMAKELSAVFSPEVEIISAEVHTDPYMRRKELMSVAKYLSQDSSLILKAIDEWDFTDHARVNVFANYDDKEKISIMIIGKMNRIFDYTYIQSPLCRFMSDVLNVNILDPETMPYRDMAQVDRARKLIMDSNISHGNDNTHWPHELILHSVVSNLNKIDGIVFLRDCFCISGLEDIKILQQIVNKLNIPNIICSFNMESRTTTETILETFTEMLKFNRSDLLCG